MARHTASIVLGEKDGRDAGKRFLLTEMPASQGEEWAIRAMAAMVKGGLELSEDVLAGGFASLAVLLSGGMRALLASPWVDLKPLLDEMMDCIAIQPDEARPEVSRRLIETDVEEIATRTRLREEVLSLHLGFSVAAELSSLAASIKAQVETGPNTGTSGDQSEPSSLPS